MENTGTKRTALVNEIVRDEGDEPETKTGPNERWGCLVVLASFYCIAILDGVGYTTGILLDSFLQELGGGRAEVSLAGSLQVGVYCLSGPLVGKLVMRFGARPVCIAGALLSSLGLFGASYAPSLGLLVLGYSIVTGFGFGLMYIPCVVGVAPYFTDRRALAIGICLCGSGFGTFGLAPIAQHILDNYGWRWVLRTFSAFSLVGVLCGAVMVPVDLPEEDFSKRSPPKKRSRLLSYVLGDDLSKSRRLGTYYLFTLADFLAFTAIYIPYTHLPPLAKYRNISSGDAAFLISAGGISNTIGRLVGGWLSDQSWTHPILITVVSLILAIIPSFVLPWCLAYWTFLISFGFFGFITGCVVGCTNPALIKLLGLNCLSQAFGIVSALRGVAAMAGPPLAGLLVDDFLEPGLALYLCGALLVASACIGTIAAVVNSVQERRAHYVEL
eukprot:GFUD01023950.1.p1 GENE.GFUD01023950.1~~GFUD01023950.1.p1  ORF type:complete len:442 (-),score=61.43 GFUD01023950.1:20-1345(-)